MHRRLLPVAILCLTLAACGSHRAATPSVQFVPVPVDAPTSDTDLPVVDDPAPSPSPTDAWGWVDPPLFRIWEEGPRKGTHAHLALWFLQALQQHDDVAAARELNWNTMGVYGGDDERPLHATLNDVRHNAGLDHAAPCTQARPLSSVGVVVFCGSLAVVVHVGLDPGQDGVCIGDPRQFHDVYPGPHTYAYAKHAYGYYDFSGFP